MVAMRPKTAKAYPKLKHFVDNHLPKLHKNSKVYNAYIKWAEKGGMHSIFADLALQIHFWPFLEVESLTKANGKKSNGRYKTSKPETIFLDKAIAERFEKDYKLKKAITLVESTILHELVHWADWTSDNKHLKGVEEGKEFEKEAYGKDIQRYF